MHFNRVEMQLNSKMNNQIVAMIFILNENYTCIILLLTRYYFFLN